MRTLLDREARIRAQELSQELIALREKKGTKNFSRKEEGRLKEALACLKKADHKKRKELQALSRQNIQPEIKPFLKTCLTDFRWKAFKDQLTTAYKSADKATLTIKDDYSEMFAQYDLSQLPEVLFSLNDFLIQIKEQIIPKIQKRDPCKTPQELEPEFIKQFKELFLDIEERLIAILNYKIKVKLEHESNIPSNEIEKVLYSEVDPANYKANVTLQRVPSTILNEETNRITQVIFRLDSLRLGKAPSDPLNKSLREIKESACDILYQAYLIIDPKIAKNLKPFIAEQLKLDKPVLDFKNAAFYFKKKTKKPLSFNTKPTRIREVPSKQEQRPTNSSSIISKIEKFLKEVLEETQGLNLKGQARKLRQWRHEILREINIAKKRTPIPNASYTLDEALVRAAFNIAINYLRDGKAFEAHEKLQYCTKNGIIILNTEEDTRLKNIRDLGRKISQKYSSVNTMVA